MEVTQLGSGTSLACGPTDLPLRLGINSSKRKVVRRKLRFLITNGQYAHTKSVLSVGKDEALAVAQAAHHYLNLSRKLLTNGTPGSTIANCILCV